MRGYTYNIYGVRLRVEADDGPALRSLVRLLGGFSEVGEGNGGLAADARLALRFVPHPVAPPEDARLLFRHREVRGLREGARLWLTDGWSRLAVDAAVGQAEGDVHPGSWTRERDFEQAFLLLGLLELLRGRGRFHLHAAALRAGDVGILAAGDSGSGKSTMTYAWAREGGDFLGDDAVLLRMGPSGVIAGAWPEPLQLDPALAAYFPELAAAEKEGGPKAKVGVPGGGERAAVAECRPGVLLLPSVTPGVTRIEPLPARAALAALVPASALLLADPTLAPAHLEALRALVLQCRCYRLLQGPDLLRRPQSLRDLLWAIACPQEWTAHRP